MQIMVAAGLVLAASTMLGAGHNKDCKYTAAPGTVVSVVNQYGDVDVKANTGRQVLISTTSNSEKVEVDCSQNGSRIDAFTHFLQPADSSEGRVDYQVQVPADASVSVRNTEGPTHVDGLHSDVIVRSDAALVDVSNLSHGHLHIFTINGPIRLTNVSGGHVEVLSTGGRVDMTAVTGPKVTVNTTTGDIVYNGDFGGSGEYTLMNHSGNIHVTLPVTASVDLDVNSVQGNVLNDFPLRPKIHVTQTPIFGHSFTGTSLTGASSVLLRSFSGTIHVSKR